MLRVPLSGPTSISMLSPGGSPSLRQALSRYYRRFYDFEVDPDLEITVCCGATESMISTMLGVVNRGDNIIIFEPFYENYGPDAIISGATPHFASLDLENDFAFDPMQVRALVEGLQGRGGNPCSDSEYTQQSHRQSILSAGARVPGGAGSGV